MRDDELRELNIIGGGMMVVDQEYLELRNELHFACNRVSMASILEDQLSYAQSMAVTKTDAGLLQRDKDILTAFLGCVGYEFINGGLRPKAHCGDMIYEENLLKKQENGKTIFEFSDDRSNLSVLAYYTGDVLHFCATDNFIKAGAPWYMELPVLEATFNVQEDTFWFMYRPHCLTGKLDKDKAFKACRVVDLLNGLDEDTEAINIEDLEGLLDKYFDPSLTVDVISREIDSDEKYGLPDLFEGFQTMGVL